jgi:CRP/FNR family transcriptional regulator, cyclic AMP receptor protein
LIRAKKEVRRLGGDASAREANLDADMDGFLNLP